MMRVIGALVLTYFISRGLRLLGLRPPSVAKLVAAHVLSFGLLTLLAIAMRYPLTVFNPSQLVVVGFAQAAWLLLDLYRAQVAFWKPPVTPATGPAPTTRAGSNR